MRLTSRVARPAAVATAIATLAVFGSAGPALAGAPATPGGGHPSPRPVPGSFDQGGGAQRALTGSEKQKAADKDAALAAAKSGIQPNAMYSTNYFSGNQQGQWYNNYCGPATLSEMLGTLGHPQSQSWAASKVGISPNNGGTSSDSMNYVLNNYTGGGYYYARVNLPYTPSSSDTSAYIDRMTTDIDGNPHITHPTAAPVAGNSEEVHNGPLLPGHPDPGYGNAWYHWFDIRGYQNSGATSMIEDSATTVWTGVPAYSNITSSRLVTIMGDRGYNW